MKLIENQTYSTERSLYLLNHTEVKDCYFGNSDIAESPLKECNDIAVSNCKFDLRYPCWHDTHATFDNCEFSDLSRAAFWYDKNIVIVNSKLLGVKALRECNNVVLKDLNVVSPEFGWKSNNIYIQNVSVEGEYPFMSSTHLTFKKFKLKGKYSFQYTKNVLIEDSDLDTKDAFWHSKNVTVKNCVIKGEYIGWDSKNLTLINCKISGTQPFCYCKNLKLINCEMFDADLAFEYSSVKAILKGKLISIKNPSKGTISVPSLGKLILENSKYPCNCSVIVDGKKMN